MEDLPEWQKSNVVLAGEIMDGEGTRFLPLPSKYDVDEWRMMRDFVETVSDQAVADDLTNAIHGRGAFRYFKDRIRYHGVESSWYAYRDMALKEIAVEWCTDNQVEFIDDTGPSGSDKRI